MWAEPPWGSTLEVDACLRAIPATATMTGMFLDSAVALARAKGHELSGARARYVAFQTYPLREHCQLLVDVARAIYPTSTLREGPIIHMTDIHNVLDSHNVGVFEGVMRHAKVEGTIELRRYSRSSADFLCAW